MVNDLESLFPGLAGTDYRVTSPSDRKYNCIAWAAADTRRWWWPDPPPSGEGYHWPSSASNEETLVAFVAAFASLGYAPCTGDAVEPGWERIALYATDDGAPTHAARQLLDGRWTSKLGGRQDIEHRLRALEGEAYGSVVQILKRPASR